MATDRRSLLRGTDAAGAEHAAEAQCFKPAHQCFKPAHQCFKPARVWIGKRSAPATAQPAACTGKPNRNGNLCHGVGKWRPRRWCVLVWSLGFAIQAVAATPLRAAVDPAAVQRSIDRGVAFLKKTQQERGGWSEFRSQSCGLSALCTLALLNAGVDRDDPSVARALRYLRGVRPQETYSVALQTLVYCQAGAAGDLPRIRENVRWLIEAQKPADTGSRAGSWSYNRRGPGSGDPSNAQFALLALGAAVDRGVEVDPDVFRSAADYWRKKQKPSGGWSYFADQATGSMTCAGIASLIIAEGRLGDAAERISADSIDCCGDQADRGEAIRKGIDFLGRGFSVQTNPGDTFNFFYYMYALERVGRLSGQRLIGGHDWYREGTERLVALQDNFQGYWSGANVEADQNIATSFALLFLSKGKRQVVAGRLKYATAGDESAWQRHPDSLRQLVRHIERDWRRDLTWQTVDGSRATLEDLLQTPVLVIGGDRALDLDPKLVERLGEYIEQGGTIVFDSDGADGCGDATGFAASVNELCDQWFDGESLERLPPSHPVWFAEHRVDPAVLGDDFWIQGVQSCCRTPVFFAPRSLACRWELGGELFRRAESQSGGRREVDAAIRIGENIVAYATGRELKDKLEQRTVLRGDARLEAGRGTIPIATLELGAGGEDARRALPNAVALVTARLPIELVAAAQPVGFRRDALREVPLLWVHGRTDFRLDRDQRELLREFLLNGGFVLGSSVCGSEAFTEAFRREFAEILPEAPLDAVRPDHPVLSESYGGFDIRSLSVRSPNREGRSLEFDRRRQPPRIEIAAPGGMAAVFFSPLDISCALESANAVACPGYDTEDAAKIVTNLILYALHQ